MVMESMHSAQNMRLQDSKNLHLWRTRDIVKHDSDSQGEGSRNSHREFKSSFAKELELKEVIKSFMNEDVESASSCTSDLGSGSLMEEEEQEKTLSLAMVVKECINIKVENQRLKSKMKTYNERSERYTKLEQEVHLLTWQLSKVCL